jgi:transposase
MAHTKPLIVTDDDRETLESLTRTRTLQAQIVTRARIILLKADGESIDAIADKVNLNRNSVMLCLKKYREGGIENAIYDAPGRGRNSEITDDEKAWIIDIACRKPTEFGYAAETWTYAKLTAHINETAESAGHTRLSTIAKTSIKEILDDAAIKPFRINYYCENRDPEFESKMHNVLVVYKQISMRFDDDGNLLPTADGEPETHTISYDEKPGIQAIATTTPDRLPTVEKGVIMRDYEYIRHGTVSLLAAIDLLTGEAIPLVRDTHKSSDFIEFLKLLDKKYPKGDKIRLVLDNHTAHTSKETRSFLATLPGRFEFVFTPKHGSWLNMIEGFFGKMTHQMLRGIRVQSKEELTERIYKYFYEVNKVPVIHHWKYKMDEIDPNEEVVVGLAI